MFFFKNNRCRHSPSHNRELLQTTHWKNKFVFDFGFDFAKEADIAERSTTTPLNGNPLSKLVRESYYLVLW